MKKIIIITTLSLLACNIYAGDFSQQSSNRYNNRPIIIQWSLPNKKGPVKPMELILDKDLNIVPTKTPTPTLDTYKLPLNRLPNKHPVTHRKTIITESHPHAKKLNYEDLQLKFDKDMNPITTTESVGPNKVGRLDIALKPQPSKPYENLTYSKKRNTVFSKDDTKQKAPAPKIKFIQEDLSLPPSKKKKVTETRETEIQKQYDHPQSFETEYEPLWSPIPEQEEPLSPARDTSSQDTLNISDEFNISL